MSTVSSSLNPGVANLLQTLTKINSSVMNSPAVVSALENAPAADIVRLSEEATQLQGMTALFGGANSDPNSNASNMDTLFGLPTTTSTANPVYQALENAGATLSPSQQMANAQATAQAQLTQGLFGAGTNPNAPGILFNTLA